MGEPFFQEKLINMRWMVLKARVGPPKKRGVRLFTSLLLFALPARLSALPVPIGEVEIGLESFDGYQEGMAYVSTDESGTMLELFISYKGFGLDNVTWTLNSEDLLTFREVSTNAAWWRSRLLEMNIEQAVENDAALINPKLVYSHRKRLYPFEGAEHLLKFVRQGRDYALTVAETSPGAGTKQVEEKTLPVFTLHFAGAQLPILRDIISDENVSFLLSEYAAEKAKIQAVLEGGPSGN